MKKANLSLSRRETDQVSPRMAYAPELFDTVDYGIAVYRPIDNGADFEFVDINKAGETYSNIRRDDAIGRRVTDVFPGVEAFGLLDVLRTVAETGQPQDLPPTAYNDEHRSGKWFANRVYRLDSGEVVAVYNDVTDQVRAEMELRHSEERYRLLSEATLDGIFDWNPNEDTLYLSPSWKAQLGFKPEELPNTFGSWTGRLHPDDRERVLAHLEEYLQNPDAQWHEEFRLQHKDGHYAWLMARATAERDDKGQVTRLLGVHIDINLRHEAEQRFRDLVETTTDWVWESDASGRYNYVSPQCYRLFGYAPDELVGRNFSDLMTEDNNEAFGRAMKEHRRRGEPYSMLEASCRHRDGHVVHIETSGMPVRDQDGQLVGFRGIDRDISRRHEANAQLRLYERAISTTPYLMSFIDRDYIYRMVNEAYAARHQRPRDEIVGMTVAELMGEDMFRDVIQPELDRCFKGELIQYQYTFDFAGKRKHMDVQYHPYRRGDGMITGAVVSVHDITELHRAEERVRQAAQVFSSTIEGVTITDLEGTILDVNEAFCRITGYERNEAIGKNPRILQSGRHDAIYYKDMWSALLQRGHWRGEIWNRRKDGLVYPETLTISQVRDDNDQPSGYVAVFADISAAKQNEARLQHLAHHDPLTQLPNRLLLDARLEQSVARSARYQQKMALLFIDLDRFKHINDSLGHSAGDLLLKGLATRLQSAVRGDDTIARISGDEFVAVLENIESADNVTFVVRKIMQALTLPFEINGNQISLTCSIGISLYPHDGDSGGILMRNADAAMYRAKDEGRNTYQFYSEEMTVAAFEHLFLENALRNAIRQRQFELAYQPQVRFGEGALVGLEALIRWRHPEQGFVPPGRFIPVAEQTGLIRDIGAWVLDEACRQARSWLDQGLVFQRIAVNISGNEIQQAGFADQVEETLRRHDLNPGFLELEITESFVMQHADESVRQLKRLNALGVRIAVDDFGTGYSSLAYLKSLPVDVLKIDQSFVRDIPDDSNDLAIVEAIVVLGRALGLDIIAEGVETQDQVDALRERGCRQGQGYHFAQPANQAATTKLLKTLALGGSL
jgi:diguanylate cyclase (GGDEF)-like protein/PAS domain S-box-containing protein